MKPEQILDKIAYLHFESHQPSLLVALQKALDAGQTPKQIMLHLGKQFPSGLTLNLVECALAHMQASREK